MITEEVKQLFKEKNTSALRVAREIGVTHTYMYQLLSGVQQSHERRKQIARALRVSLVDLAQICGWN